MSKTLKMKKLGGTRTLLALSLAGSLAAFGCTTDRTVGNGNLNDYSGVRSAPTSGVMTGSESAPLPPPMTSSYSRPEALPNAQRTMKKLAPDEAALLMLEHKPAVRVLGPVSPAASGSSGYSATLVTGQLPNPATRTNAPYASRTVATRTIEPPNLVVPVEPVKATSSVRIVTTASGVTVTNQQ